MPSNAIGHLLGQVSINGTPATTDAVVGSTPPSLNTEHQIVFTHDPDANTEALYVDGIEVGIASARGNPANASYSNFWIGRSQFSADPFFNGTVDELRTYDSALTPSAVSFDFSAGPNVVPEPSILGLACMAFAGLLTRRRNFRSARAR